MISDQEAREAFDHVMAGTTVKPFVAEAMFPLWLVGFRRGEPKYQRAAFYPLMDPEISFQWPWFVEWRGVFAKGEMPDSWTFMAMRIKDQRLALREDMVQLLSLTISATIGNRHDAAAHARSPGGSRPFRALSSCPLSEQIATGRLSALVPGDWRTYPPYFPGDASSITRF